LPRSPAGSWARHARRGARSCSARPPGPSEAVASGGHRRLLRQRKRVTGRGGPRAQAAPGAGAKRMTGQTVRFASAPGESGALPRAASPQPLVELEQHLDSLDDEAGAAGRSPGARGKARQALQCLLEGNRRFCQARARRPLPLDPAPARAHALAAGPSRLLRRPAVYWRQRDAPPAIGRSELAFCWWRCAAPRCTAHGLRCCICHASLCCAAGAL